MIIIPFLLSVLPVISGTIVTADGQPASSVNVTVVSTHQGAITDDKGNFQLQNMPPGKYLLRVSLAGYVDSSISVELKQNETIHLQIKLQGTYLQLRTVIIDANIHGGYVETKPSESIRLDFPLIEISQNINVVNNHILSDQGLLTITEAIRNVSGVQKNIWRNK